ncbi:hypothetical protein SAMN05216600_11243 [Pseudomonas cuatrocienegasensis]|uniref:Uncharacterized protein n=1 Tax=Pseudomonas cuatrocienegasensis TaxID=543360 RepID=A0ABY1BIG3_9PSED|nr:MULTISPECIES: hypothetical protein [Pseudomonas]SEQ94673.1 hypothetical protein SAMN05216600_11243 [Pseudomonas cuatrocienegasensis]
MPLTPNAARMLRDGGIDACAALNSMLIEVLAETPAEQHREIKLPIARLMAAIFDETVNKAVAAYPELNPSDEVWIEAVRTQAEKRIDEVNRRQSSHADLPPK